VWKKSLLCPGFPHRDVIDEFLIDKDKLPTRALAWKRPKIFHMMVRNIRVLENVPLFTDCLGVAVLSHLESFLFSSSFKLLFSQNFNN